MYIARALLKKPAANAVSEALHIPVGCLIQVVAYERKATLGDRGEVLEVKN